MSVHHVLLTSFTKQLAGWLQGIEAYGEVLQVAKQAGDQNEIKEIEAAIRGCYNAIEREREKFLATIDRLGIDIDH